MENSNGGDDCNNSTFTVFSSFRDLYHRGVVFVTTMKSGVNDASLWLCSAAQKRPQKRSSFLFLFRVWNFVGLFFVFSDDDVIATEKKKKKCGKMWEEEQKMENNTTNNNKKAL